jgi:hypothetical protein
VGAGVKIQMDEREVALGILNDRGHIIERISLPARENQVFTPDRDTHQSLLNIFHSARRQAMHVDEAIEALLEQLQK